MLNPDAQTLKHITSWVKQLHDAVPRHDEGDPPTKEKWAVLASLLGKDYPSGAFTMASLHATAQGLTYFPGYEIIRQRVGSWWQANMPAIARGIDNDSRYIGLSTVERRWMAFWDDATARGFKAKREGDPPMNAGIIDSMIRRYAPRVWDRLNPAQFPASITGAQKSLAEDWADDEGIYELRHKYADDPAALGLLRDLVTKHAPQHMHMVPEKVVPSATAQSGGIGKPVIKPAFLTPDQIAAAKERKVA
ncbi:MAG TPA: hypothetical protein VL614_15250 [Acetobacteraceae bacterium]|jgi:hypothetical protein|nr:hypothetical protein [Acetobacteraceae bacterium]